MIVLKFGGTSVGTAANLANVKRIVEGLDSPAVVVVSALGGLTDMLIATAKMAASGNQEYLKEMEAISLRHHNIVSDVIKPGAGLSTLAKIDPLLQDLKRLYDGVCLIGDLPERTLCQIVSLGERMSSIIVADMIEGASHHDSLQFIKTEKWYDRNIAATELTTELIQAEFTSDTKYPVVVGGFIATDKNTGEITNLGRGGSDYTAALIAAALDAEVLQIWTDVDGFLTSDPRIIPEAHVVPRMSFVESMDLCTYGAKVIYPPTIYPVFHKNIPIRILNTFHPEVEGTYIADSCEFKGIQRNDIAGISSLKGTSLFSLRGRLIANEQNVHSRAVNALSCQGISILLMTQSPEETLFSFAIDSRNSERAVRLLKEEFAPELVERDLEVIEVTDRLATLAVVGDGIRNIPEISNIIIDILELQGIKVLAMSDKASETTVSFVIYEDSVHEALSTLHTQFFTNDK
ncbi:MAG: aspartate kinase [Muribaculaceae bacterium]|nr:aspartate kinase [Muribaculaceae bacterium]